MAQTSSLADSKIQQGPVNTFPHEVVLHLTRTPPHQTRPPPLFLVVCGFGALASTTARDVLAALAEMRREAGMGIAPGAFGSAFSTRPGKKNGDQVSNPIWTKQGRKERDVPRACSFLHMIDAQFAVRPPHALPISFHKSLPSVASFRRSARCSGVQSL